ncbi:alpha/beta hydrolase family protein [Plastoroseomonas arctica]|uniref:Alpha/beta hydrolase n=1 Tax=Plastoroseomonas arctica TaxID=1509237 RepID=A0AAF1JYZ4_9PROT|nr:alpha/beta hydrolase [Plastoroseomonas arctica]MBR0657437.1 alpha/beta hydrolase [Plastoroseomonas arctica]
MIRTLRAVALLLPLLAHGAAAQRAEPVPAPSPPRQPATPPAQRALPPRGGGFEAFRTAFSAASLPPGAGAGTVTGWALHYRGAVPHAAFVIAAAPNGRVLRWRFVSGRPSAEAARRDAGSLCESQDRANTPDGTTCRILATDLAPEGQPAVMEARTETLGPFRASPFHWRHGPERAAGVLLWSHGYGGRDVDSRNSPAPGFVSLLNDAGWDVYRFDRSPLEDDLASSLPRLLREAPLLRGAGYRRVVLAGQSRGAWQSLLLAGAMPESVDAVVATAPAAHGAQGTGQGAAVDDFRRALAGFPDARPRLAVALFDDDPFDPDVAARTALVEALAARRTGPTLLIRPGAAIRGHGGASEVGFTQAYGACLLTFLMAPEAAAPRGLRRAGCGGG